MKWSYVIVGLFCLMVCWFFGEYLASITWFWLWHPYEWMKPIVQGIGVLALLIMIVLGAGKGKGSK